MVIEIGDIVTCREKVEMVTAIYPRLKEGDIGIVVDASPEFSDYKVYGVVINGNTYYLFADEIEKIEPKED